MPFSHCWLCETLRHYSFFLDFFHGVVTLSHLFLTDAPNQIDISKCTFSNQTSDIKGLIFKIPGPLFKVFFINRRWKAKVTYFGFYLFLMFLLKKCLKTYIRSIYVFSYDNLCRLSNVRNFHRLIRSSNIRFSILRNSV